MSKSTLISFDGSSLRYCIAKSNLMNILGGLLPQQQPQTPIVQPVPHSADPPSRRVVITDAMAVVQSMGKPLWVRNGRNLVSHFVEVVDPKSNGATEVHVVFSYRYDIPNSLKEESRQKRQGMNKAVVYKITADHRRTGRGVAAAPPPPPQKKKNAKCPRFGQKHLG